MQRHRALNGASVKAIREALGKSQVDLAQQAGISTSHLCQLERRQKQPSLTVMARLACSLCVPLDAITYPTNSAELAQEAEPEGRAA